MADRTPLRIADHNDIADDDPFAELTRIMGFDPRQPIERQARAEPEFSRQQDDFEINLEDELIGSFEEPEAAPAVALEAPAQPHAFIPAPQPEDHAADADASDEPEGEDGLMAAFEQEFAIDSEQPAPAVEAEAHAPAFSDIDTELAASLDHGFDMDMDEAADAPSADDAFDAAFAESFEAEPELEAGPAAWEREQSAPMAFEETPAEVAEEAPAEAASDDDFVGHFDQALADAELDREPEFAAPEPAEAVLAGPIAVEEGTKEEDAEEEQDFVMDDVFLDLDDEPQPVQAEPAQAAAAEPEQPHAALDDDFELDLDQAFAEPEHEMPAASAHQAAEPAVEAASPAPAESLGEPSLEDELNALLGRMGSRSVPEPQPAEPQMAAPAAPAADAGETDISFDDDAFDAAFASSIALDEPAAPAVEEEPAHASRWSLATPFKSENAFWNRSAAAEEPSEPAIAPAPAAAPTVAEAEPTFEDAASDDERYEPAASAARHEEMPELETVDVPERVVALADDLDIPELEFEEDQPAVQAYDDLDAEFAGLLSELGSPEPAAAAAEARTDRYDDDAYNAGFASGAGQQHDYMRDFGIAAGGAAVAAAAGYAAASQPAAAQRADAAYTGYSAGGAGGKPQQTEQDDFGFDELDYDSDLEEAMSIPEPEAAQAPRRRGLLVASVIGAVAVLGGLGAFALSFGGNGSGDAPVIVKADNQPIKVKPENPGGMVVPNQDNKVYDAVAKGAKPAEPVQQKLVTNAEEPVDVAAKEAARQPIDLSPDEGNADVADAAPPAKSEDRISQTIQEAEGAGNQQSAAVTPRKVKTMVVKPDGSLAVREDQAPANVAASEPNDPAPQMVGSAADGADVPQATGAVPATDAQDGGQAAPAAADKDRSAATPARVPVAPQRPSDQPVDVVGEVKPEQVASVDAAAGGSWAVQIASQPTAEAAQSTYQDLAHRYAGVLGGHGVSIVKAEIAGKGTFYRVRVPAKSRTEAVNLCTSYKAAGGNCFVSK